MNIKMPKLEDMCGKTPEGILKCLFFDSCSDRIMGSLTLQPDMTDESTDLQLESDFLKQLKDKYVCRVKVRSSQMDTASSETSTN